MSIYAGRVVRNLGRSEYYETTIDGQHYMHLCAGCAYEILGRGDHDLCRDSISWGYDGSGPELLSAALIGCVIDGDMRFNSRRFSSKAIRLVRRHYRAFTEEFVVHFTDAWSMDEKQIRDWVASKEKQLQEAT